MAGRVYFPPALDGDGIMFCVRKQRGDADHSWDSAMPIFTSAQSRLTSMSGFAYVAVPLTAQSFVLYCELAQCVCTLCVLVSQLHVGSLLVLLNTLHLHNLVPKGLVVRLCPSKLCLPSLGLHHSNHGVPARLIHNMGTRIREPSQNGVHVKETCSRSSTFDLGIAL